MSTKEQSDIRRKLRVLEHGKENGNISKTCRYFGVSREPYYKWKRDYQEKGESALINSKPCPQHPKLRIPLAIEEKILYLGKNYCLGQLRISWYLLRYHNIKVSPAGVWWVLKRNGLNKLPQNQRKGLWNSLSGMKNRYPGIVSKLM